MPKLLFRASGAWLKLDRIKICLDSILVRYKYDLSLRKNVRISKCENVLFVYESLIQSLVFVWSWVFED